MFYADSRFLEHIRGQFIAVAVANNDADNTGIDDHLGTNDTGMIGAIQSGTFRADSMQGRLNNRVLFRVQTAAQFMTFTGRNLELFAQTADIQAMLQFGGSAVITGGQNPAIAHQAGPYRPAQTGAAPGNQFDNIQKISIPIGTLIDFVRNICDGTFFSAISFRFLMSRLYLRSAGIPFYPFILCA